MALDTSSPDFDAHVTFLKSGWRVSEFTGSAADFHERDPGPTPTVPGPDRFEHQVWVHRLEQAAVVLGSGQRDPLLSAEGGHYGVGTGQVELCRRRSGGGLVFIDPASDVWIDLIVPSWSSLWDSDVGRSFHWLGELWRRVLHLLVEPTVDHTRSNLAVDRPSPTGGRSTRSFFCFADIGHGEVRFGEAKVVGISQRRTKDWIRLQSLLVGRWKPTEVERALNAIPGLSADRRADLGAPPHHAASVSAGLPESVALPHHRDVVSALLAELPDLGGR